MVVGALLYRTGRELHTGWAEHRRYVAFSLGLFVLGTVAGAAMYGRVDLFAALGVDDLQDMLPGEFTLWDLYGNNARVLLLMVVGALTAGLLTAVALLFNGVILGYVGALVAGERGPLFVAVGILPHGVFELFAFFVASAIGFRIVANTALRITNRREVVLGRGGWLRAGLLLVGALLVLFVAAVVEVFATGALLQLLFG